MRRLGLSDEEFRRKLIDYAYALATKYGEGASAAACDMYDAISMLQNAPVPSAVPARTATYQETAKAINGTLKTGNDEIVANSVGRLVKLVGADTLLQNSLRDGAEWAWIPQGETCAFCLTLASRGWQEASKNALKNGHAEHIHANCDCMYCIRHTPDIDVEGYEPDKYLKMYKDAEGTNSKQKINSMRRKFYADNKEMGLDLGEDMDEAFV